MLGKILPKAISPGRTVNVILLEFNLLVSYIPRENLNIDINVITFVVVLLCSRNRFARNRFARSIDSFDRKHIVVIAHDTVTSQMLRFIRSSTAFELSDLTVVEMT